MEVKTARVCGKFRGILKPAFHCGRRGMMSKKKKVLLHCDNVCSHAAAAPRMKTVSAAAAV